MNVIPAFLRQGEEGSTRDETVFHPSEATQCELAVWFLKAYARGMIDQPPMPYSANTLLTFRIGHLIHEYLQDRYVAAGICQPADVEVPIAIPEHNVTGSIDMLLRNGQGHPLRIVDFKTISWTGFSEHHLPKHENHAQVSIYCESQGIDDGELQYVCKDGGRFDRWLAEVGIEKAREMHVEARDLDDNDRITVRTYEVKKDPELVERAFAKFDRLEQLLQADTPPLPEYSPCEPISPCTDCGFRYHCRDLTGRDHPALGPAPWDT